MRDPTYNCYNCSGSATVDNADAARSLALGAPLPPDLNGYRSGASIQYQPFNLENSVSWPKKALTGANLIG
jgi:hypothetical protein